MFDCTNAQENRGPAPKEIIKRRNILSLAFFIVTIFFLPVYCMFSHSIFLYTIGS